VCSKVRLPVHESVEEGIHNFFLVGKGWFFLVDEFGNGADSVLTRRVSAANANELLVVSN
jgi:hypothetical protein